MRTDIQHYKFLAASLAGEGELPTLASPEALFSFASSEHLLPALYPRLRDLKALRQLPSVVVDALQSVYQLNLERNQVILSQAHSVIGLLNSVGIEPIALKGLAYFLTGIVRDPAIRYLFDLDFLIPECQLSVAIDVLSQAGYTPYTGDGFASFRHHAPPMQRANSVSVELHHSIGLGPTAIILPASEIASESTLIFWGDSSVRIPSPDHLLTHLILHSQIHHPYHDRIFPPIRAMYDLLLMTRHFGQQLNWREIQNRFRTNGEKTTLLLHLRQVHETLGMALPFSIQLGAIERLRWLRRRLLNSYPAIRFLDPYYLGMSAIGRRFRLLRAVFTAPSGWKKALKAFCSAAFYRRILSNL